MSQANLLYPTGKEKVVLRILGTAEATGSPRGFLYTDKKTQKMRAGVSDETSELRNWKAYVRDCGRAACAEPLRGHLEVRITFYFLRPKGHFGTGKNAGIARARAPHYPLSQPRVSKLTAGIETALEGIVWEDADAIVDTVILKRYGDVARVEIEAMEKR